MMTKLSVLAITIGLSLVGAVNIKHYSSANCQNGYGICSNIGQNVCCKDDTNAWGFASAAIGPIQYYDIGAVYSQSSTKKCGIIKDSQNGPITCLSPASANGLDGAAWFDCTSCMKKRDGSLHAEALDQYAEGQSSNCTSSVGLDKLVLSDGHMFDIGPNMSSSAKSELYRHTFTGSTINDLTEELLAFEIDHEGVQKRAEENGFYAA